jgi:hypothetical protein
MREQNVLQAPVVRRPLPLAGRGAEWSTWVECQQMLITFASHRLEKDAAVLLQWGACRDWQDFLGVQESWTKEALHDYGKHVRELIGLMAPDDIPCEPPPRIISRDCDLPQATSPFA